MRYFTTALLLFLISGAALAAIKFPTLTGRVVDNAHILSPQAESDLTQQLAAHESSTTEQIVVATVPSLDGNEIEPYANGLFRHWQLGQKDKNNGVLLLVAPAEHRVRIEVGYGLEGILTDAISSQIIQRFILPKFKTNELERGTLDGTQAILTVLGGGQIVTAPPEISQNSDGIPPWLIVGIFIIIILFRIIFGVWLIPSGGGWRGGGFSGGGGSSGGGGASGRW